MNRRKIEKILIDIGLSCSSSGFDYISEALMEIDKVGVKAKMSEICRTIAKRHGTSASAVQRAIQYSLDRVRKSRSEVTRRYIGNPFMGAKDRLMHMWRILKWEEEDEDSKDQVADAE